MTDSTNANVEARRTSLQDALSTTVISARLMRIVSKNERLVQALADIEDDGGSTSRKPSALVEEEISSDSDGESGDESNADAVFKGTDTVPSAPCFGDDNASEASRFQRWYAEAATLGFEVVDCLSETNEDGAEHTTLGGRVMGLPPPLNVRRLRRNAKRCLQQSQPYLQLAVALMDIVTWRWPLYTLLLAWAYFSAVLSGWLIPAILALFLLQLGINYLLTQKHINLGISLLPSTMTVVEPPSLDLTGAQLVLNIARRSQVALEICAESMEKLRNLLLWKNPDVTLKFLALVSCNFLLSAVVSTSTFLTLIGVGFGAKFFITEYFFYRFPRLRKKLGVFWYFYERIPSTVTLRESVPNAPVRHALGSFRQFATQSAFIVGSPAEGEVKTAELGLAQEQIIAERSCILYDKQKSFPSNVGIGTLLLMESRLVFKYQRLSKGEQEVVNVHFDDIKFVTKRRTVKTNMIPLPGAGHALEIGTDGNRKPYVFCGINNREEFFRCLMTAGVTAAAQFASDYDVSSHDS